MIVGPGWAFLALVAAGIAAFVLVPGIGLLVVDEPADGNVRLAAPVLVQPDPGVETGPAAATTVSLPRARAGIKSAMLRIRSTGCDGVPTGAGFALARKLLIADRRVLPGAGAVNVARRGGTAKKIRAAQVYRLGDFGVARLDRGAPKRLRVGTSVALGAPVAVVGYPPAPTPQVVPGVVVDRIAGTSFGVRGEVLRLSSVLPGDAPGGPVVDARGRVVGVAFATDPKTGFAVAVPVSALESLVAKRGLEPLPACDGA